MKSKTLAWIVSGIMAMPLAFAFFLDSTFQALGLVNLPQFYLNNSSFIDTILFMIFFGGLCMQFLKKRMGKKPAVVIGIILGLSLGVFFYMNNITIAVFGPIAMAVFVFGMAIAFYMIFHSMFNKQGSQLGAWMAYLITLPLFMATVPELFEWLQRHEYTEVLYGIMLFFWAVAFIYVIWKLFSMMKWGS
ncbi:MAG: hypothetical protein ACOCWQ_00410, partial [Nanoarchaeota archaeon]